MAEDKLKLLKTLELIEAWKNTNIGVYFQIRAQNMLDGNDISRYTVYITEKDLKDLIERLKIARKTYLKIWNK